MGVTRNMISPGREHTRRRTLNTSSEILARSRRRRRPTPDAMPQVANPTSNTPRKYVAYFRNGGWLAGTIRNADVPNSSTAPLPRKAITAEIVMPTERFIAHLG